MTKITKGSGNVFKDLGYKDPEDALTKTKIALKINEIIKDKGYTQKEAAKILGIDQPKVSSIKNGKLRGFSLEKLFTFLNTLDHEIEIIIKPKDSGKSVSASTQVVCAY